MTESSIQSGSPSRRRRAMQTYAVIALVEAIVVLVTLAWCDKLDAFGDQHQTDSARDTAAAVSDSIRSTFESYSEVLYYTRGYFLSSQRVDFDEWETVVREAHLERTHPGVWGFGYVLHVEPDEADALVREMHDAGVGDFAIRQHPKPDAIDPDGPMYVVKYEQPESRNRAAWGLNVASNKTNRRVYDESMLANEVRVSAPFPLKQRDAGAHQGVVMALPHFAGDLPIETPAQRREAILGWTVIVIDLEYFLNAEWRPEWEGVSLELSSIDGHGSEVLLFASDNEDMVDPVDHVFAMAMAGGNFTLHVGVDRAGQQTVFHRYAALVLVGGACTGLALGVIVWLVARSRDHAQALAERMTERLRASEAEHRELARHAEQANRAKSMFLANMSHEIRTPMTAILGFTDVISDHLSDDADRGSIEEATRRIQAAGSHLLQIINDILDISKIESGKIEFHPEPVSPRELVDQVISTLENNAQQNGVALKARVSDAVPRAVACDAYRVRQILINLVGNALKFTQSGSVSVRVGWDQGELVAEVQDTGIGIAPDKLEQIFRPFTQADESLVRQHQGTGLGLAISRSLAHSMGGMIVASSTPGQGSIFRVTLPAPRAELAAGSDADATAEIGVLRGRVLVADDGPDNRRLLRFFLERAGLDVEVVENGAEAVDAAWAGGFDVVIMDMQMPVLDGYDAARELRARGYAGSIMALTAHALATDRAQCLAAGCDIFQTKPIDRDALLAQVGACLRSARAA